MSRPITGPVLAAYQKSVALLKKREIPYMIVGGVAAGLLGEPRATMDIDLTVALDRNHSEQIIQLLRAAKTLGFRFNQETVLRNIQEAGAFQLHLHGRQHVDFILASHPLEQSAFRRKRRRLFFGRKSYFPSPEDLILLKIVPNREIDQHDIKNIFMRHGKKLDVRYLTQWAQKLSDESQDMRIFNQIRALIHRWA